MTTITHAITAETAAIVRDTLSSPEPQSFTRPEFFAWHLSGATGDAVTSGELTRADAETAIAAAYDVLSPLFKRVRDAQAECLEVYGDEYAADRAAYAAWHRGGYEVARRMADTTPPHTPIRRHPMTTYTITSRTGGVCLGLYQGETIEQAADEARSSAHRTTAPVRTIRGRKFRIQPRARYSGAPYDANR